MKGLVKAVFLSIGTSLILGACAYTPLSLSKKVQEIQAPQTIVVLPFETSSSSINGEALSEYFALQVLTTMNQLTVIEAEELIHSYNKKEAIQLGQSLNVDAVLIGKASVEKPVLGNEGDLSTTIELIDVHSGLPLWTDSHKETYYTFEVPGDTREAINSLMYRSAKTMVNKMDQELDPAPVRTPHKEKKPSILHQVKLF